MKNSTIMEFTDLLASKSAVPGGGSVAALCGGLSAALVEMVSNLTIGNKKYSGIEEKMAKLNEKAMVLHHELLDDIEKDSNAYMLVMNAYKLPKNTDEEKKQRNRSIQEGLKKAALVPMEIASKAYRIMELSKEVVAHGNKNAVTDGMVSAIMARSAVLSALLNVKINLGSIKDNDFVMEMNLKANELQKKCIKDEKDILNSIKL